MGLCVADICDMRGSDWLLNMVPKNLGRNNPSALNIFNTFDLVVCVPISQLFLAITVRSNQLPVGD